MKPETKKIATDYFISASLIAISGFPFLCMSQINFFIFFLIAGFIYLKRSIQFDTRMLIVVFVFLVVETLQFLIIKPLDPIMISGTFIRMFVAFFAVSIGNKSYLKYYVNIIYFFSIVSFLFFIPSVIYPAFFNFFVDHVCPFFPAPFVDSGGFYEIWPTNILFCFHECVLSEFRNPGPFWEPGLFATFLNLALIFNLIIEKKIWTRKNIVLTLALISTFSTAGYIAFFLLIFSFFIVNQSLVKKIAYTVILLPLILILYFNLDFLNSKVEQNINLAGSTTSSRFGSAEADLNDFYSSPFIGWGRGVMRYGGKQFAFFSEEQHRNNSVTDLLATYGIFIFFFYFYCYYNSLKWICTYFGFNPHFAWFALLVILVLGFSQTIFLRPFFYNLLFLQFIYKDKRYTLNSVQSENKDVSL